jgi:hypothetical protein
MRESFQSSESSPELVLATTRVNRVPGTHDSRQRKGERTPMLAELLRGAR